MKDSGKGWRAVRLFGSVYVLSAVPLLVLILAGVIHLFSPDLNAVLNAPQTIIASLPYILLSVTLLSLTTSVWMKRGGLIQIARAQGSRGSLAGNLVALILVQLTVTAVPCFLAAIYSAAIGSAWILQAAFAYAIATSVIFKPDFDGIHAALSDVRSAGRRYELIGRSTTYQHRTVPLARLAIRAKSPNPRTSQEKTKKVSAL